MANTPIKDAATIILVRDPGSDARVLMGQRGANAAFMPNKFVFPGGAVDTGDKDIPLHNPLNYECTDRLGPQAAHGLTVAAVRELWEEAGLVLGRPGHWDQTPPLDWTSFAKTGHVPDAAPLHYVFRAITPPRRPRRFDARFFLADAGHIVGDIDDFSAASDELSHLQWVPFNKARSFNLPFITEVVLAEIASQLPLIAAPASVPFFNNQDENSLIERLGGRSPLAAKGTAPE